MPIDDNINKLRALLVILVVLIHSHNVGLIEICDPETSAYYTVFDNILTQKITAIALPGLFLISGYLFCRGLKVWECAWVFLDGTRWLPGGSSGQQPFLPWL